jgi:hypothetical protein
MMKIYVYEKVVGGKKQYRMTTRIPVTLREAPQELVVPKEAAYLLLASQNGVDALNDALGRMYNNGADHFLTWVEIEKDNWEIGLDEADDQEPVAPEDLPTGHGQNMGETQRLGDYPV